MRTPLDQRRSQARRIGRLRRIGSWALALGGGLALVVGLPWLVWRGPYLLDRGYINTATLGQAGGSAALITGLRTALVACVAAIGASAALVYTIRNYRLTRRGQVTERFTKALERLGSDQRYVRIGAVLALEQIVQDAPEQATHAAHVLGHFVRDRAPARPGPANASGSEATTPNTSLPTSPEADIQVALTALTRPEARTHVDEGETLNLENLHLARAHLREADLSGAELHGADLGGANLFAADLARADLRGVYFFNAHLFGANLTDADLSGARLNVAHLGAAELTRARLVEAALTRANLGRANLTDADLRGADLTGANLAGRTSPTPTCEGQTSPAPTWQGEPHRRRPARGRPHRRQPGRANLTDADLRGADLTGANLAGRTSPTPTCEGQTSPAPTWQGEPHRRRPARGRPHRCLGVEAGASQVSAYQCEDGATARHPGGRGIVHHLRSGAPSADTPTTRTRLAGSTIKITAVCGW